METASRVRATSPTHPSFVLLVKVGAILSAAIIIYWRDFLLLISEALFNELTTHVLLIPFFIAYMIYRKRLILRAITSWKRAGTERFSPVPEGVGLLLFALAMFVYWYGSYTPFTLEYHFLSLVVFVAGCILFLFNVATLKVLAAPIVLLLFLVPPPLELAYRVGAALGVFAYQTVHGIASLLGLPLDLTIENQSLILYSASSSRPLTFVIDVACAGVYSLIAFAVFAPLAAYFVKGSKLKKLALLALGFPIVYGLNIIRITLVVLVAYFFGEGLAVGLFHTFGGWVLVFLGTLGILLLAEKLPTLRVSVGPQAHEELSRCQHNPGSSPQHQGFCVDCGALLKTSTTRLSRRSAFKTTVIVVAALLITSLEVPVMFSTAKGLPEIVIQSPSGAESAQFLPTISEYELKFVNRERNLEEYWHADAYLNYVYIPSETANPVVWTTVEISDRPPHGWECVYTWPVTILNQQDVRLSENPPIIGRFISFQFNGYDLTQIVFYWRQKIPVETSSATSQKYAKVSLVVYTDKPEEFEAIQDAVLPMGQIIINYWQPTAKAWSKIVMSVAQYGHLLISATIGTLIIVTMIHFRQRRIERKLNFKKFNCLALAEEKQFLQAVDQAAKQGKATGDSIASAYEQIASAKIKKEKLRELLHYAEEADLLETKIANKEDKPLLVWKTKISFPKRTT